MSNTIKEKMTYDEYKRAAKKHLYTCEVLIEKIRQIKDSEKKKSLLLNLYYLSGYIIECSIKFGIYDIRGYQRNQSVDELNTDVKFKDIKTHKFLEYSKYYTAKASDSGKIPLIGRKDDNKDVNELYTTWDSILRYKSKLDKSDTVYIRFFECAKEIFDSICLP